MTFASEGDHDAQKQIERLLIVWQDRMVLSQSLIDQMRAGFTQECRNTLRTMCVARILSTSSYMSLLLQQQQVDFRGSALGACRAQQAIDDSAEGGH